MLKFPLREIYSFHTLFTVLLFSNTQVLSLLTQPVARQAFRVALLFFMLMSISSRKKDISWKYRPPLYRPYFIIQFSFQALIVFYSKKNKKKFQFHRNSILREPKSTQFLVKFIDKYRKKLLILLTQIHLQKLQTVCSF